MFTTSAAIVALSALTLVSAQANSNSTFKIDPSTVDISDRVTWCQGETDSCTTLCGTAIDNSCSTDTLDFQCTCQGGNSPDMNLYQNTVPWYVCERLQQNCIVQFENNAAGQRNCTQTYGDKCGTEQVEDHAGQGATGGTSSSSTVSASGSATAAASNTAAPSSSSSEAAAVPTNVQYLGNGAAAVAVGLSKDIPEEDRWPSPVEAEPTLDNPYRLQNRDMWSVGSDSSVSEHHYEGYNWQPVEVRSPAMWTRPESFEQVQFVVNILTSSHRLRINPTCGLHVHVGNGKWFLPGKHIRRLGTFLWAADPMISRLHPPWRRISESSRSIRYETTLSQGDSAKDIEKWIAKRPEVPDHLPVTDCSDTTREEKELGGKEKWEEFARWRNERGPLMTIGEECDGTGSNDDNADGTNSPDESIPKSEILLSPLSEPEFRIPSVQDIFKAGEELQEEGRKIDVPPEEGALHRNIGWVRWDELQPKVAKWVRKYAIKVHGHSRIEELSSNDQLALMIRTQCAVLFGHTDLGSITKDQEYQILVASSPYLEAGRSRWDWNPRKQRWERNWQRLGNILHHTSAQREIKIDAPYVVRKFENMAKLLELDEEGPNAGIEYVNEEEYSQAIKTNRGIKELLESLKDYADSPGPHYLDDIPEEFGMDTSPQLSSLSSLSGLTDDPEHVLSPSPSPPFLAVALGLLRDESPPEEEIDPPDPSSSGSSGSTNRGSSSHTSASPNSSTSRKSETKPQTVKLMPHDPDAFLMSYKHAIARYTKIDPYDWHEIAYLPISVNPFAGAAAAYAYNRPIPTYGSKVTTGAGIAEITASESALAVAELLSHSDEHRRLNYNFAFYRDFHLRGAATAGPESQNLRTIEFREAAGSLDAQWVSMWMRVCAGIIGWTRSAPARDIMVVLDKILAQEQRELRRLAAGGLAYKAKEQDDAHRYDVCDLLDDIGLFPEAGWIRKRERERGPPM
ncbi:hypothetical protein F5Y13DRAFT_197347 [Hypoxylon sp. FL1857]|nr:hypothetical protein F5Y13DRAFT_197347 [Hypoxylon sp. FL1857]